MLRKRWWGETWFSRLNECCCPSGNNPIMLFIPALTDRATLPGEWRGEAIFRQNRPIADYGYTARLHGMAKSYVAFLAHRMSFFWRVTQIEQ